MIKEDRWKLDRCIDSDCRYVGGIIVVCYYGIDKIYRSLGDLCENYWDC